MVIVENHCWLLKAIIEEYQLTFERIAAEIDIPKRTLRNLFHGRTQCLHAQFWRKLLTFYCFLQSRRCYIELVDENGVVCFRDGFESGLVFLSAQEIRGDEVLFGRFSLVDRGYIELVSETDEMDD